MLVTGSVGIDDVATQEFAVKNVLGGAASFASVAASLFSENVRLVSVVGDDFPDEYIQLFKRHCVDLEGLKIVEGKTFRWSGVYEQNMNHRRTLFVELNASENYFPQLPASYHDTEYVLLGNMGPDFQSCVLRQIKKPKFVIADTMDLWIKTTRKELMELLQQIDLLVLNDGEASMLSDESNLIRAAAWLHQQGPKYIAIKKGEHGCYFSGSEGSFITPAFPLEKVVDPTGAGDTFVGGLTGYLAATDDTSFENIKRAIIEGTILASFTCEDFSLKKLTSISQKDLESRKNLLRKLTNY